MRSNSSILPDESLRDSSIFPRRSRFSKMLSAGGQPDQLWIAPALLGLALEELDRAGAGPGAVVRPVGGDGVVDVRELQDLRRERELRSLEPVGVARPVEPLVVPADDGQQVAQ